MEELRGKHSDDNPDLISKHLHLSNTVQMSQKVMQYLIMIYAIPGTVSETSVSHKFLHK